MDGLFKRQSKGSFTDVQAGLHRISKAVKETVFKGLLALDKVNPQDEQ